MAGTNEFAFFAVEAYVPVEVQNQAEKKIEKCLPAGPGTKIYFPVSVLALFCTKTLLL